MKKLIGCAFIIGAAGCQSPGSAPQDSPSDEAGIVDPQDGLDSSSIAFAVRGPDFQDFTQFLPIDLSELLRLYRGPSAIGQATGSQLKSLKYAFTAISICQDMTRVGTGWTNPRNCISLYSNEDAQRLDYSTFFDSAARSHDSLYVDLLNKKSVSRLRQAIALEESHVGTYRYILVSWMRPVKYRAEITLNSGRTLYTHDGIYNPNDASTYSLSDFARGPADEAVQIIQNGGNTFEFSQPLLVTADDIKNKIAFRVDLIFNPDRVLSGTSSSSRSGLLRTVHSGDAFFMPILSMPLVPHRKTEKVIRETYLVHQTAQSANPFDVRLELFSIDGDEAQAIYSVNWQGVMIPGSTSEPMTQNISSIDTGSDGALSFLDYQGLPMLSGFNRLAVGQSASVTLHCNGSVPALTEQGCISGSFAAQAELIARDSF